MAPSSGHLLVPKVLKVVRLAIAKTNEALKTRLAATETGAKLIGEPVPVLARARPSRPLAILKQARSQKHRSFTHQTRTFISSTGKPQHDFQASRSQFQTGRIGKTIHQADASPFASTLRPNLTGGTLPRSAGGYGLGGVGKARHFSHTSGCQAQVVQNVGNGIRAFIIGGGKVRFDGLDPMTGEKRYRKITATQEQAYKRFDHANHFSRGTTVEFKTTPTITALSAQGGDEAAVSLQDADVLATLSSDFARSLRTFSQIAADLQSLSKLGDLPIFMKDTPAGPVITVHFPGCDADLVNRLCDELGVTRGLICEDPAWGEDKEVEMALLFPFAPNGSDAAVSEPDPLDYFDDTPLVKEVKMEQRQCGEDASISTLDPYDRVSYEHLQSPALQAYSPSGYESLEDTASWTPSPQSPWRKQRSSARGAGDFEGVEGIYRFIQLCDEGGHRQNGQAVI